MVDELVEVSKEGRAPKNDPAIFALAICCAYGTPELKQKAYGVIHKVCRTGTHLFMFMDSVTKLRNRTWTSGLKRGISKFYTHRVADSFAYNSIKYRQRLGWTHRDVLRLTHTKFTDDTKNEIARWIVKGGETSNTIINAFLSLQKCTNEKEAIKLITENNLPWEAMPTELHSSKKVWESLVPNMPLTALIRNLGRLTSLGVIGNMSDATLMIAAKLTNEHLINASRIHPINVYNALKVYMGGGFQSKGKFRWDADNIIANALDSCLKMSFKNVEPTNKRIMFGCDVSQSMTWNSIKNMHMTPMEAMGIMLMATANVEKYYMAKAFSSTLMDLKIAKNETITNVMEKLNAFQHGATNMGLVIDYAIKNKTMVDAFVFYTDNEVNQGSHLYKLFEKYKRVMNPNAKVIVIAMEATRFTNIFPDDINCLDLRGFDSATPKLLSEFIGRE
jgi:60 kDa SS-A/Ro ribonucleoprotein